MNYDEFKLFVKEHVSQYISQSDQIDKIIERQICKNHVNKDALIVNFKNINVSPTIYFNDYWKNDLQENDALEITKHIAKLIENNLPEEKIDLEWLEDFDLAKNSIIPKVVGIKGNEEYLENLIYSKKADLAVTYSVYLENFSDENGVASIPVTNLHARKWGVSAEVLEHVAKENMKKIFSPRIFDMADFIPPQIDTMDRGSMYVILNSNGINGANVFLNDEFMDFVSKQLNGDFYLLPSSIHELICLKASDDMHVEELERMVQEVNYCQVAPEERLSDHVYKYDYNRHEIYRADQEQERVEELNANQAMHSHISR